MNKPLVIAHRGASYLYPENTLIAFSKAIEMGADMIECDVHRCLSGELVVIHDDEVERTTNGKGKVSKMTLENLKSFDAGDGQRIPTLQEVIDLCKGKIKLDIELKHRGYEKEVVDLILKNSVLDDVIVSCFDEQVLKKIKEINKKISVGCIIMLRRNYLAPVKNPAYDYIILNKLIAKGPILKVVRKYNKKVIIWTVNYRLDMRDLISKGVDGIITDKPNVLREVISNWGKHN